MRRKYPLILLAALVVFISVPMLFWYGTWFGLRLDDTALREKLGPESPPRHVQHAVEEITQRFEEGLPGMDPWAQLLVEASRRPDPAIRVTCAWGMQFDPGRAEFTARLREMVTDDDSVAVRRNAATSLARSNDDTGLPVIRSMLEPLDVFSPGAGVVRDLAAVGRVVRDGEVLATLETAREDEERERIRAPVPGRVARVEATEGDTVEAGALVVVLAPDPAHVLNAVVALGRVGTEDDVERLEFVAGPRAGFGDLARQWAQRALAAIRERAARENPSLGPR
jgi:biotin carboxyl carrier protein